MTESNISVPRIILGATVFVIIFRLFSLDLVGVRGTSMLPTLIPGQTVLVNRLAYGVQIPFVNRYIFFWNSVRPGDIIVFNNPVDGRPVVKRCIATAGMPIEIMNGSLMVSGNDYPMKPQEIASLARYRTVPDGMILAVGDNLNRSIDSRAYGFISLERVRGRILGSRGEKKQ